jgi:hypothetical protein
MVVVSSTLAVGPIEEALDVHGRPTGEHGRLLAAAPPRFLEDLAGWAEAAKARKARREPPY